MGDAAGVAGDARPAGQRRGTGGGGSPGSPRPTRSPHRTRRRLWRPSGASALPPGPAAVPGAVRFRGSGRNYEAELSRFTLIGVLGFGDAPVGVVTGEDGEQGGTLGSEGGGPLAGFKVEEVGMEGLRLTADGQEFLLPLYAGPPTAAAGALRTETTRRDAAQPAPGSAAPARPVAPPASGGPGPPRRGSPPRPRDGRRAGSCADGSTAARGSRGTAREDDERRREKSRRNGEKTNETDGLAVRRAPRCSRRMSSSPRGTPTGCPGGDGGPVLARYSRVRRPGNHHPPPPPTPAGDRDPASVAFRVPRGRDSDRPPRPFAAPRSPAPGPPPPPAPASPAAAVPASSSNSTTRTSTR